MLLLQQRTGMSEMLPEKHCLANFSSFSNLNPFFFFQSTIKMKQKLMGRGIYLHHILLQTSGVFLSSIALTFSLTLSFTCPHIPQSPLFFQNLSYISLLCGSFYFSQRTSSSLIAVFSWDLFGCN